MEPSPPRREQFQTVLEGILGTGNVYFQPPDDSRIEYPCLVYELDSASKFAADNGAYKWTPRYQVSYIYRNPLTESAIIDVLAAMPLSSFSRHFATSGLNHDVFTIYY